MGVLQIGTLVGLMRPLLRTDTVPDLYLLISFLSPPPPKISFRSCLNVRDCVTPDIVPALFPIQLLKILFVEASTTVTSLAILHLRHGLPCAVRPADIT